MNQLPKANDVHFLKWAVCSAGWGLFFPWCWKIFSALHCKVNETNRNNDYVVIDGEDSGVSFIFATDLLLNFESFTYMNLTHL